MGKRRSLKQTKLLPQTSTEANGLGVKQLILTASSSFFEKAALTDCPATALESDGGKADAGETTLLLDGSADVDGLIAWFREGTDGDPKATLAFPASLSKFDRAHVHALVKAVGLGSLQSVSMGIGDERFISIVRGGEEDQSCQLTPAQEHKSFWIYRWARDANLSVSRDEVAEMLLSNALTAQMEQLWNQGSSQQKLIIKLCDAIVEGDGPAFQELLAADDVLATVRSGKYDLVSGKGILHCAAREGRLEFVEKLIEAGAPINATDGHGLTALQVSRQHPEQCEAESILLRSAAFDPTPNEIPVLLPTISEDRNENVLEL